MTLEQLNYFLETAKCLNFTRAAENLYVHQTTLSRSIASLEEEIGAPLFFRLKHTLQLTSTGILLCDRGHKLMDYYDAMRAEIANSVRQVKGHLSFISLPIYFQLLSAPCKQYAEKFPNVDISVDVVPLTKADDVITNVADRSSDIGLAFSNHLVNWNPELDYFILGSERPALIVNKDNPLADFDSVELSQLHDSEIFIRSNTNNSTSYAFHELVQSDNNLIFCEYPNYENILLKLTGQKQVALMPSCLAVANTACVANCKCVLLKNAPLDFQVILLWRKDNPNPSIKSFIKMVQECKPFYHQTWEDIK